MLPKTQPRALPPAVETTADLKGKEFVLIMRTNPFVPRKHWRPKLSIVLSTRAAQNKSFAVAQSTEQASLTGTAQMIHRLS